MKTTKTGRAKAKLTPKVKFTSKEKKAIRTHDVKRKLIKLNDNDKEVRLKVEFKEFLALLKGSIPSEAGWEGIARAIGVSDDTIAEWRRLPEAKIAKLGGIIRVMNNLDAISMEDYRANKELLNIYGMAEKEEPDVQIKILRFEDNSPKAINGEIIDG